MTALFKDKHKQDEFTKNGYAIMPFLEENEIQQLLAYYQSLDHGNINDSLYVTCNTTNGERFNRHAFETMQGIVSAKVAQHFANCRMITSTFLVKKPNPKNRVLPHQDWTTVDEARYNCISVWTALVDIDFAMGPLGAIAGSHRFFSQVLCSPSAHAYRKLPYAEHVASIYPYLTFHPVKAGEAFVFDNRTIHGSLPNAAGALRMAASFGLVPAEATLYHHYLLPNTDLSQFETYEIDEEFFWRYNNVTLTELHQQGKKLDGLKSLGVSQVADFNAKPVNAAEMVAMMEATGNFPNRSVEPVAGGVTFGGAS